jgi:cobalt-precorrin 5A hydrolase
VRDSCCARFWRRFAEAATKNTDALSHENRRRFHHPPRHRAGRQSRRRPARRPAVRPGKVPREAEAAAPGAAQLLRRQGRRPGAGLFAAFDGIVAIVSLGAVVRLIAPHLGKKETDPAVVVIDEAGKFVIPVLSGHLGGANALAGHLATALGATPVLTTASDARQTLAVDLLGRELGWTFEATHDEIVRCSAAVVNDEAGRAGAGSRQRGLVGGHANGRSGPLPANLQRFARLEDVDPERFAAVLWISQRAMPADFAARWPASGYPIALARTRHEDRPWASAATAARRRQPSHQAIDEALAACGASARRCRAVASIDLKADEAGLLQVIEENGWRSFFIRRGLAAVDVPNPSETVRKYTGTPSVSEAAALLAAVPTSPS